MGREESGSLNKTYESMGGYPKSVWEERHNELANE